LNEVLRVPEETFLQSRNMLLLCEIDGRKLEMLEEHPLTEVMRWVKSRAAPVEGAV
jgi:hypothetical protein